jgi:hypothetical protein
MSYNECRWYCGGKPVLLTGRLVMIGESVGYEKGDRGDTGLSLVNGELEFMNACGGIGIAMPGWWLSSDAWSSMLRFRSFTAAALGVPTGVLPPV